MIAVLIFFSRGFAFLLLQIPGNTNLGHLNSSVQVFFDLWSKEESDLSPRREQTLEALVSFPCLPSH